MATWQSGTFDRTRVSRVYHRFLPVSAHRVLEEVDLDELWDAGKRLILLDVDNTLVKWKGEDFEPEVLEWLERAKAKGMQLCIISNTRRPARLMRICQRLGIPTVRDRFKPSRKMYRKALIEFGMRADQAVMIGDQLMTDILGANRAGIDAIWVQKMEGKEFIGTRANRVIERLLMTPMYRALVLPEKEVPGGSVEDLPITKQIVRFLIVGGSSFVIDTVVKWTLLRWTPVGPDLGRFFLDTFPGPFSFAKTPENAAAPVVAIVAWMVASLNSLVWNRAWTFEAHGKSRKQTQVQRFWIVALVAVILNSGLFTIFYNMLGEERILLANVFSSGLAAVWNFVGMRFFAFRPRSE